MAEQEEFFDEKILEYRRRARNEKYSTLETGMYIKNELVQFEEKELFPNKMSIMLPSSFVTLPSNLAKLKYTSEQRPQIIKTSLDTSVNVAFNLLDVDIQDDQVEFLLMQSREALKKLNPAFVFFDSRVEKNDLTLGWFEFKSYGLDDSVYNLLFITQIGGKMAQGVFNCKYEDAIEWRDAAHQIINSIRDITREEDKHEGTENYCGTV